MQLFKKKKKKRSAIAMLIISIEEMNDIMKIVNSLDDTGLLIKGVSETIKNEAEEQKGGSLGMVLGTLGVSLLGDLVTGKGVKQSKIPGHKSNISGQGVIRADEDIIRAGRVTIRAGEGTVRACQNF